MMDEILGPGAQIPVQINLPSCSNGATAQSSMLGMSQRTGHRSI